MIGVGIVSMIAYIVLVMVLNAALKRKIGESMMIASIALLFVVVFKTGTGFGAVLKDSFTYSAKQDTIFVCLAFIFMAYVLDKTGVMGRLIQILNSLLGWLPGGSGYVATVGTALFGMVSGVATANTASVGSVTIPWMKEQGYTDEQSATIICGNSGLGAIFPPSTVMMVVLSLEVVVAAGVTSSQLYVGLLTAAIVPLLVRLAVVYYYARKNHLKRVPKDQIMPLGKALKENGSSLVILLGVIIPLLFTMFGTGAWMEKHLSGTEGAFKSITMIFWIPTLTTILAVIEGWKYLPHTLKGWFELFQGAMVKFGDLGAAIFFTFMANRFLTKLGMTAEFTTLFEGMVASGVPSVVMMLLVILIVTLVVGPINGTATSTAMGPIAFLALRAIGISPLTACVAFIGLVSNQGIVPPGCTPVFIASGIANVKNPLALFKDLFLFYVIPQLVIVLLLMLGVLPVFGA